jgi:hypothetical protein
MDKHCKSDPSHCRGADYCACQCDRCFEAHFGHPRTDFERFEFQERMGYPPLATGATPKEG